MYLQPLPVSHMFLTLLKDNVELVSSLTATPSTRCILIVINYGKQPEHKKFFAIHLFDRVANVLSMQIKY